MPMSEQLARRAGLLTGRRPPAQAGPAATMSKSLAAQPPAMPLRAELRRQLRRRRTLGIFVVLFVLMGRDYLAPYRSVGGQLVLMVVIAIWVAGVAAMTRLGRARPTERFLIAQRQVVPEGEQR